jgi:hypothetical protein
MVKKTEKRFSPYFRASPFLISTSDNIISFSFLEFALSQILSNFNNISSILPEYCSSKLTENRK